MGSVNMVTWPVVDSGAQPVYSGAPVVDRGWLFVVESNLFCYLTSSCHTNLGTVVGVTGGMGGTP